MTGIFQEIPILPSCGNEWICAVVGLQSLGGNDREANSLLEIPALLSLREASPH